MGATVALVWVACAALGYFIGKEKGRAAEGFGLGLLLGVVGIAIIFALKPGRANVPFAPGTPAVTGRPLPPPQASQYGPSGEAL
jgi:hypothetical protein